jgi:hypothetical protein
MPMADSALLIIQRRRAALSKISRMKPTAAPTLVKDPLRQLPTHGGGSVAPLPGGKNDALIWRRSIPGIDDRDASSVWVRFDDLDYADNYQALLTHLYGAVDFSCLRRDAPRAERHQVDHVYGRVQLTESYTASKAGIAISVEDMRFHLLEGVPYRANSSGGGNEKKNSRSSITGAYQREQRLLNWMQILKLYGLASPRSAEDGERIAEAQRVLGADGYDPAEVAQGLDSLIALAAKRDDGAE